MADAITGIPWETSLPNQVLDPVSGDPVTTLVLNDFYVVLVDPTGTIVYSKPEGEPATVVTVPVTITHEAAGLYAPGCTFPTAGRYRLAIHLFAYSVLALEEINVGAAATVAGTTLTSRATVQAYLGAKAAAYTDGQIDMAVAWAGQAVKSHCERLLEANDYHQWFDGPGGPNLFLPEYPILALRRVCTSAVECISITNSTADAIGYSMAVVNGKLYLTISGGTSAGTNTLTLSTYATMALLVAAINALGSGWAAAVEEEGDPVDIRPGVEGAQIAGTTLYIYHPADEVLANVDRDTGGLAYGTDWPLGGNCIFVNYRAGHETIPADLQMIATQAACEILFGSGRERGLSSEKLGDSAWAAKESPGILNQFKDDLKPYRRRRL